MKVNIQIVNAFIDGNNGGNPAGVVLNANDFSQHQKLRIAQKVGLSETAFVSKSSSAEYKLEFFTPTRQIAHCGHATIAVFSYLAQTGMVKDGWISKETIDGNRKILIKNNTAYMEQVAPKISRIERYSSTIFDSICVNERQVIAEPKLVNTGNSFVVLEVENKQVLSNLKPDYAAISTISEKLDLIGFYIFCRQTEVEGRDATSRMFAPSYGIKEESATGMAAGPLACYLYSESRINKNEFMIEQGYFMKQRSPSLINVTLDIQNNNIISLMAGGDAKLTNEMVIEI